MVHAVRHVQEMVKKVDAAVPLGPNERAEILDTLELYECWEPYFKLIRACIDDPEGRSIKHYVRLAKVQNLYLEDVAAASKTCSAMVAQLKVPYVTFAEEILPEIIEFEDFAAEATLLSSVCDSLPDRDDLVSCLERLCMLFEKKTHNEAHLTRTYEKLLDVDPSNVKALRYFKMVFTQNNEWEEVVSILKTLLKCVHHPQEVFRVAQELAAIFLYQLDMADEAIDVLDSYCSNSPLDTSTIRFDAFHRKNDWHGCLRVLRECLLSVDEDDSRSVLHFRIAALHEQLADQKKALENYEKAATLRPTFMDAYEGIVTAAIAVQDWVKLRKWLATLTETVHDDKLQAQLMQALKRLEDGLSNATKQ